MSTTETNTDLSKRLFATRLKKKLYEYRINQNTLAKELGVSESTVGKWVLGKSMPRTMGMIERIAARFNVEKSYFLDPDARKERVRGIRIPVLGRVAAGIPIEAIEDVIDYEEIPETMTNSGQYFALQVHGDSMLPTLHNGDVVIVRQQPTVESGEIAIVQINGGDATVKEVKESQQGITLIGHNVAVYTPHFYSNRDIENMPVRVLGKVVELRRKF